MDHPTIRIITNERRYMPLLLIEAEGSYLEYTDKFGRTWKLEPITNPNIMMPFKITPLPQVEGK